MQGATARMLGGGVVVFFLFWLALGVACLVVCLFVLFVCLCFCLFVLCDIA